MSDAPADSLRLTLDAPDTVRAGDTVTLTFRVENSSGRALDLYLRGREPVIDVLVRHSDGTVLWHNLRNASIPAILQLKSLQPAESFTVTDVWSVPPAAARETYTVEAGLLAEGQHVIRFPARLLRVE